MPFYAYKCNDCGYEEDVLQKMSDARLTVCPKCGGTFSKQVTAASFHLKGTGWYKTDFRDSGTPGQNSAKADQDKEKSQDGAQENVQKDSQNEASASSENKADQGSTNNRSEHQSSAGTNKTSANANPASAGAVSNKTSGAPPNATTTS